MDILSKKKEENSEESSEDDRPVTKRARDTSSDEEIVEKKVKKTTGRKKKTPGTTGYLKSCKLSPELAAVMGSDTMPRHEVVKRIWAIVKEKNLYDPKNKQFAICNAELLPVFGMPSVFIHIMVFFIPWVCIYF